MAAKKPATKKTATKAKVKPKAKPKAKAANKKGNKYACDVCGMVVSVDTACDCVDACDLVCCGEEMVML